ncbi:MAG: four helix bundle protein [Candidatus Electrothrix sp. LOE2]|nr:four helix bundle protein [Candidatus Electrothrix sp. LOE2]
MSGPGRRLLATRATRGTFTSATAIPTTTFATTTTRFGWCAADSDFVFCFFVMQGKERLPIWRDANRLLLEIEQAVRQFPRYHKYAAGADLRQQAMLICRLLVRALSAAEGQRAEQVGQLRHAVDDLKVLIQLAKEVKAFQNFRQFEEISKLAVAVGRQGGAWHKRLTESGSRPASDRC